MMDNKKSNQLDQYGWFADGNKVPEEKRVPFNRPTLRQIIQSLSFVSFVHRYLLYWLKNVGKKEQLFINMLEPLYHKPNYGVPCGGIGSGSIGRDFRCGFCKFGLRPGLIEQDVDVIKANQFLLTLRRYNPEDGECVTVYQKVLSAVSECRKDSKLKTWDFSFPPQNLHYRGLYPRSWTKFCIPEHGVTIVLRQISPIFPNEYKDTSLPVVVFVFDLINESDNVFDVSISFSFRNGTGSDRWSREGRCRSFYFESEKMKGVRLEHTISNMQCNFGVAASTSDVNVTRCSNFNPSGDGGEIWFPLYEKGFLNETSEDDKRLVKEMGIAVSVQCKIKANSIINNAVEFALAWDMPVVQFGDRKREYRRRYTRFFGADCKAASSLCEYALSNFKTWEAKIIEWQSPILSNRFLPDWYKSALFNELYFMTDGGSVWFEYDESWLKEETHLSDYTVSLMKETGRFGYLESWEYRMLCTYDVHFYASFSLAQLWPQIEHVLQAEFADQIELSDNKCVIYHMEGNKAPKKCRHRMPHDLGSPAADPWLSTNAYLMHDTSNWKDLNLKFVLTTFRDYKCILNEDQRFLKAVFPSVKILVDEALKIWDLDGDGMIENSGIADQTYDAWKMGGVSAYCGSLWLATLRVTAAMADDLGMTVEKNYYLKMLDNAKKAFIKKLWNGEYFNFDERSRSKHTIMADQLCGYWFLQSVSPSLANEILPSEYVKSTLNKIYNYNVLHFAGGRMGAVNGMKKSGKVDRNYIQADEMWTGITYALSAFMIQEGEVQKGFDTGWGCYNACYHRFGLQYQTPEALYEHRFYRAIGYMRPLSIWAIQWALEKHCALLSGGCALLEGIRTTDPNFSLKKPSD